MATNNINGKFYVGLTKHKLNSPIKRHRNRAANNAISHFYNAIRKHGFNNFHFEVIDSDATSYDHLKQLEIWYIEHLKPEYNMTKGGDGVVGLIITDETRKKLSTVWKGRKRDEFSLNHRLLISESKIGKPHFQSKETKIKIGLKNRGKKRTKLTLERMSKSRKGEKATGRRLERLRTNFLGKKHSEEAKAKIGLRHLVKRRSQLINTLNSIINQKTSSIFIGILT